MTIGSQTQTAMGQRVRNIRKKRGLTLQQVSEVAGVAVSTLSKIERGLLAPTYDKFAKIAAALGVEIPELYSTDGAGFEKGAFLVSRAGDCVLHHNDMYTYELLFAGTLGKSMLPALCSLKPLENMVFDDHVRHNGEEFVYVISGQVIVHLEGKPPVVLNAGDSAYFDCSRGHIYSSAGKDGARVLFLHAPGAESTMEQDLRPSETG